MHIHAKPTLQLFSVVVISLFFTACHKDDEIPVAPIPAFTALDNAIKSKMSQYNIPGLSIAIAKDDKLIYTKSYGFADKEAKQVASNNNLYRIASISKPITAIAILKLVQDGKLNTSQTVFGTNGILGNDFGTPSEGSNKELITVQHLLDHVSGWTNNPYDPTFNNLSWTQAQMITDMVQNRPLTSAPGATFYYLNFGYVVLGRVIEKITNTTYENYVKTNLLAPSGITDMRIGGNTLAERYPDEVKYYPQAGLPVDFPYSFNVTRADAAGGWVATSSDLIKFIMSIDRDQVVPDIISNQLLSQELYFGFYTWVYNGSIPGSNSELCRLNDDFSFAILTNTRNEDSSNDNIFNDLYNTMYDQINSLPSWPGGNANNPLAGVYNWKYRRWDSVDTTTDLAVEAGSASGTVTWEANSSTQLQFWGGYAETIGINVPYVLSFTGNGTNLSNLEVKIDPTLTNGLSAFGVTVIQDPSIMEMTISPTRNYFKIWYRVKNPKGTRTLIDEYWM